MAGVAPEREGLSMGPAWVGYALWLLGAGGIAAMYVVAAWPYPRHTKRGD